MGGEVGAGVCGGVRVGLDGHGVDVGGAHERPAQGFDAVVNVVAEYVGKDIKPRGRRGVGGEVGVLTDHILCFLVSVGGLKAGERGVGVREGWRRDRSVE